MYTLLDMSTYIILLAFQSILTVSYKEFGSIFWVSIWCYYNEIYF